MILTGSSPSDIPPHTAVVQTLSELDGSARNRSLQIFRDIGHEHDLPAEKVLVLLDFMDQKITRFFEENNVNPDNQSLARDQIFQFAPLFLKDSSVKNKQVIKDLISLSKFVNDDFQSAGFFIGEFLMALELKLSELTGDPALFKLSGANPIVNISRPSSKLKTNKKESSSKQKRSDNGGATGVNAEIIERRRAILKASGDEQSWNNFLAAHPGQEQSLKAVRSQLCLIQPREILREELGISDGDMPIIRPLFVGFFRDILFNDLCGHELLSRKTQITHNVAIPGGFDHEKVGRSHDRFAKYLGIATD